MFVYILFCNQTLIQGQNHNFIHSTVKTSFRPFHEHNFYSKIHPSSQQCKIEQLN